MKDVTISTGSARAMLTQMLQGGRPEISILLGEMATMPLSPVDEVTMRDRIGEALAGMHPDVTAACVRHLGTMHSCTIDVALLRNAGLDPAVVGFVVATMDALDVTARGCGIHFSKGPARLHFDLPIGGGAMWNAAHDHRVYVGDLPGTLVAVLSGRIDEAPVPLRDVLTHPVLDEHLLAVTGLRQLSTGSCILELAVDDRLRETTLDVILMDAARNYDVDPS